MTLQRLSRWATHPLALFLVAAAGSLAMASCGGDSVAGPAVIATIQVTPGTDTLVALGRTRQLSAVPKDGAGNPVTGVTIRWHSSVPAVATVDSVTGIATAVTNGTTIISAVAGAVNGQASLIVAQVVGTVQILPASASFTTLGDTVRFTATAKDSNGATVPGVRFLWVATNDAVATVDTNGLATARGAGTAFVTAAGRGVPASVSVSVTQAATQLAFTAQPTGTSAASAISPSIQVEVRDAGGRLVTSSRDAITIAIGTNPGGGTLTGTTTVQAVGGIATFSGLAIAKAAIGYTLSASASGMGGATSSAFDIAPGAAAQIVFTRQPPARVEGNVAIDSIVVAVRDSFGNAVPSGSVSLSLGAKPWPAGSLTGTTTQAISNGVAKWIGAVRIDKPGVGYVVNASLGGIIAASGTFRVGLTFQSLSVGEISTCGITTGGTYCWGSNFSGLLAQPSITQDSVPVLSSAAVVFTQVAVGGIHACGLTAGGQAYCWGRNVEGQIGDSTNTIRFVPTAVAGGHVFTQIAAGDASTCGIATDTFTYCWGGNGSGQVGDSSNTNRNAPTKVKGGITLTQVSVGLLHACGTTSSGAAYCWGDNTHGELGDSSFTQRPAPVAVKGGLTFTHIAAGYDASCGTSNPTGYVWCWGSNTLFQLGNNNVGPQFAPKFQNIVSGVALGEFGQFGCAMNVAGLVDCWGYNLHGELGDDTKINDTDWTISGGAIHFDRLAVGFNTACGRRSDGVVFCWGHNDQGEVGDGTSLNDRHGPVRIVQ